MSMMCVSPGEGKSSYTSSIDVEDWLRRKLRLWCFQNILFTKVQVPNKSNTDAVSREEFLQLQPLVENSFSMDFTLITDFIIKEPNIFSIDVLE